jgi:FeS assembly protein IscX
MPAMNMLEFMNEANEPYPLVWEASYEIVLALMRHYPAADIEQVGLQQLHQMVVALPGFADDPALAHDALLASILREWYEESTAEA